MNFYKRHLGDYARDTAHLSMLEHGAYSLLLDRYYGAEAPIPDADRYRLARARSRDEKAAVDAVLGEFFELVEGLWRHKRCDAEIAEAQEHGDERDAKAENERERQRRHRAERRRIFAALRERDVVPPWDIRTEALRELYERTLSTPPVTLPVTRPVTPVTRTATANQTPDSRLHKNKEAAAADPATAPTAAAPPGPPPPPASADAVYTRAVQLVVMLRDRGCRIATGNPHAIEWAKAGVTDAQVLTAFETAEQRRQDKGEAQPVSAGLVNAILGDVLNPPPPRAAPDRWYASEAGVLRKGLSLSPPLEPRRGETMDAFKGRIDVAIADDEARRLHAA